MRSSRSSPATATAARSRCRRTPRRTTPSRPGIRSRSCPSWRRRSPNTRGTIVPAPAVADSTTPPSRRQLKAHSVGPRLAATLAYLAGSHRASNRGLEEITEDVFDVPIALGTVANLRTEVSDALAPAHAEAVQVVRAAAVKNVDETSWKLAGTLCWLWVAATNTVAAFLIHAHRGWDALAALLGEKVRGLVCSDRWSVYDRLSPFCRQVCWAHLKRDFQKLVDRGGAAAPLGRRLQRVAERVFVEWHLFRGGGCDRQELQRRLDGPAPHLGAGSQGGAAVRRQQGGDLLRERAGVVAGGVAVRGERGGRADEQPRGAGAAARGAVAEERLRLPERGGVPFRGTDADGGTDAAAARPVGPRLPVRRAGGTSQRPPRTFSTCGRLIGYPHRRLRLAERVCQGPNRWSGTSWRSRPP